MTQSVMSPQAKLLARFLKEKGLATISHTQALEALAHAMNEKSFNVAKAKEASGANGKKADRATQLLREAIAAGLHFGEALNIFTESRTPEESDYVSYVQENLGSDGDLEFDSNAMVSLSEVGGAYVMGWKWVYLQDLPLPKNPLDAFERAYRKVIFVAGELETDTALADLEFNEQAIEALRADNTLPASTWLVRPKEAGACKQPWPFTVEHLQGMKLAPGKDEYEGETSSGEKLYLRFDMED